MKKFLTLILAISLLLSMTLLSGCISEDMQTEIEEGIKNEVEEAIQEEIDAIEESIQGEVDDFLNRDPETEQKPTEDASKEIPGVSADDPFGVEASKKYVWGYKKQLKHKWTPVLTSFYDNETLVIYRRHGTLHNTLYMIALFEDGVCTRYYPSCAVPHTKTGEKPCIAYAPFSRAGYIYDGLAEIYTCAETVAAYQAVLEMDRMGTGIDALSKQMNPGLFAEVVGETIEPAVSDALSSTLDGIIGRSDVLGKVSEAKSYIEKAAEIDSNTKQNLTDANRDTKTNTDTIYTQYDVSGVADIVPGMSPSVENSQQIVGGFAAVTPEISVNGAVKPDLWTNLISFEELGATVKNTDFRVSETCLQWKYKDSDTWNDLKDLKEITPDGKNVVFQITNTHVQWRVLTLTEQMLAQAQANLHAAVKRDGKPALKQ